MPSIVEGMTMGGGKSRGVGVKEPRELMGEGGWGEGKKVVRVGCGIDHTLMVLEPVE